MGDDNTPTLFTCDCGSIVKYKNKSQHIRTKKHQDYFDEMYNSYDDGATMEEYEEGYVFGEDGFDDGDY